MTPAGKPAYKAWALRAEVAVIRPPGGGTAMRYLLNAFSLNMLGADEYTIRVRPLSREDAAALAADAVSAVGHADTAAVFAAELGVPVVCDRRTVTLQRGDQALVGQYIGPRLPEGATALPPGATIAWRLVDVA